MAEQVGLKQLLAVVQEEQVVDFFTLGIILGLPEFRLKVIERNHRGDEIRCIEEVISAWLKLDPDNPEESFLKAIEQLKKCSSEQHRPEDARAQPVTVRDDSKS